MEGKQMYTCPHCNQLIEYGENPCHHCGKEIGWDISSTNTQEEQNLTSEEVKETTKKTGKPWKKIIALFIFCYMIYSCFLAGNGTPQEYFAEHDDGSIVISNTRIMEYLDDLDGDKLERNKAGQEFAKLIMDKVASGQRDIIDYKWLQFNLDKYPELAPVNAIGNLALRYDFGRDQRNKIELDIQAPSELKDQKRTMKSRLIEERQNLESQYNQASGLLQEENDTFKATLSDLNSSISALEVLICSFSR